MKNFKRIGSALLVGGFVTAVVAGASLAFLNNERSIVGLGNAAAFSNCQIQGLGNRLGVEVQTVQYGPSVNCNAANPFDVQENVSTVALALGSISVASGGILFFVIHRHPELLSEGKFKSIFSKSGSEKESLDSKIRALAKLRKDGLLSDKEFEAQKQKILTNTGSGK
jgi:hypothetical protein